MTWIGADNGAVDSVTFLSMFTGLSIRSCRLVSYRHFCGSSIHPIIVVAGLSDFEYVAHPIQYV